MQSERHRYQHSLQIVETLPARSAGDADWPDSPLPCGTYKVAHEDVTPEFLSLAKVVFAMLFNRPLRTGSCSAMLLYEEQESPRWESLT